MTLKVVHINRKAIDQEAAAKELWEKVLKPKWEARAKALGEKVRAELMADPTLAKPVTAKKKKK